MDVVEQGTVIYAKHRAATGVLLFGVGSPIVIDF